MHVDQEMLVNVEVYNSVEAVLFPLATYLTASVTAAAVMWAALYVLNF